MVAVILDPEYEIFIIYIALLSSISLIDADIHSFSRLQLAGLIIKKTPIIISVMTILINSIIIIFMSVSKAGTVAIAIT